jgi:hypothetical protein
MKRISTFLRFVLIAVVLIVPFSMISAQTPSWVQIGADIYGEATTNSSGKTVSISANGNIVAIGAPQNDQGFANRGHVRVYENQSGLWVQKGVDIDGEAMGDEFGRYVSLSADGLILAVGAPFNDGNGTSSGHVRIFEYNSTTSLWDQVGADIDGEAAGDEQGTSVCLSADGTIVAMGAYKNDDGGTDRGHTRIYKYNGTSWNQIGVDIDGEADNDRSGYSVSLNANGTLVAIGAYLNDGGGTSSGHTRIYQNVSDNWIQVGEDIDGIAGDESGVSVSLSDDGLIVAVGAYKHLSAKGCTRIYKNIAGTWTQLGANIDGEIAGDQSGKFVSLNSTGSMVAIGDPLSNGKAPGFTYAGQTRVFYNNAGTWTQLGQDIEGESVTAYCGYGLGINDDGTKLAVGYYGVLTETGKVSVFDLNATETWTGTASNDWLVPENWDLGIVPTNNISVAIPADLVNYPTLATGAECDDLIIESTGTSTGSILGQSNLTINGTTTIKRQMTGNAWHLVASAAPGEDIQSFLTTNTNIPTKSGSRGMMDYNEAVNNWNSYFTAATSGSLEAGKGYSLRTDADGTIQFVGTLENGNVSPAVASTSAALSWNSVGNPYPSAIFINSPADATNNFIDLNDGNFDPSYKAVYVWEQGNNAYSIISNNDAAFTAALGQAFMVKAKTGTTNFQFTTDLQTHAPAAELKNGNVAIPEIKLVAQLANQKSSTLIKFNESMNAGLDPGYDIGMLKSGFDLYTTLVDDNGVDFGMQFLPSTLLDKSEIALGLESKESGSVSISVLTENLPLGYKVVLEDRLLGTFTELNETEIYTTDITKNAQGKGRFYLHISNSTTKIGDIAATSGLNAFYANEKIVINGNINGNGHATVFDMMGRKIKELELDKAPINSISTVGMKNGIYILNIKHEGGLFTKKIPLSR